MQGSWPEVPYPFKGKAAAASWGPQKPCFEEKVSGLQEAIRFWKRDKAKKPGLSDAYLDDLEKVSDAGFLREYVWHYLRRDRWKMPPDLRLDEFEPWRNEHLKDHRVRVYGDLG